MRIGFYGGAFNPIHYGHIKVARQSKAKLKLDMMVLVPSGIAVHKEIKGASDEDRFAMVNLARLECGFMNVSPYEIMLSRKSGKPCPTVGTITNMRLQFPNDELFLIIGLDQAVQFHKWVKYKELLDLCNVVVVNRHGHEIDHINEECEKKMTFIEIDPLDIASSTIRNMISKWFPVEGLIPPAVENYIRKTGIYNCHYKYYD